MRSSKEVVSVDRLLENDDIDEETFLETSAALIEEVYERSLDWQEKVREEEDPRDVRKAARSAAKAKSTLEDLQMAYRTPHKGRNNNLNGSGVELMVKSNEAISFVNDIGTENFYDMKDPEEIGEGEFCVFEAAEDEYVTPGEVHSEMPDSYTEDMISMRNVSVEELPDFERYGAFPEI